MLGEIAVKNLRGPYKDLWELRKGAPRLTRVVAAVRQDEGPQQTSGPPSAPKHHASLLMDYRALPSPPALQSTGQAAPTIRSSSSSSSHQRSKGCHRMQVDAAVRSKINCGDPNARLAARLQGAKECLPAVPC